MVRRSALKPLKDEKPYWFCVTQHFGDVRTLAQTGLKLHYVVDPIDVADIWKYVGNPEFRSEYSYLLVSYNPAGEHMNEIYAVKLPVVEGEKTNRGTLLHGSCSAFEGHVDKICYGWTSRAHAKHILETGSCCTGDVPDNHGVGV